MRLDRLHYNRNDRCHQQHHNVHFAWATEAETGAFAHPQLLYTGEVLI